MTSRPPVFIKSYTRPTTLIIQELWPMALEEGVKLFGITNKFSPIVIDFINHGTIEIWENETGLKYIKKKLVDFCKKEPSQALLLLKNYQLALKKLEPIWQRGYLNSKSALKAFIETAKELTVIDMFLCYIGVDGRVTGKIKEICFRLRAEDHFFVNNNQVFHNTLKKLFPKLRDYVNFLKISEIDKPPSLAELRRRSEKFVSITASGYSKVQTLKEYARSAEAKQKNFVFREEVVRGVKGTVKGRAANLGRVIGIARLVFSPRELDKVKKGDIIIAPMTTADMMPALKRAAAFVTDEGGVICHAAIVSRELGKSCLIATKGATKAFKDGDLVEVDVYRGIIRKLAKK